MKHYNIPIFISHFGCPNACVFCNQVKINGRETDVTIEDLKKIIDEYLEILPKDSYKEVAFFGGTFTGISMEKQKEYLEGVKEYLDKGMVQGIRLSTRPDYINEEVLNQLKKYHVTTIELGVQSLDEEVLKKSARYYPIEKVYEASSLIKSYGINLGIQLMPGLPGSSYESDIESVKKVIEIAPQNVRVYPTLIIKDTEMERMYKRGEYEVFTLEEAIKRCRKICSLLELNNINIIRVGLQPSEDLRNGGVSVEGAFHPAFRELVDGEIYFNFLKNLEEIQGKLEIEANEKLISKIVGIKKKNLKRLQKVKIVINNNLSTSEIKINDKIYTRKEILRKEIGESCEQNSNKC
ncbi:elongator complex protein 3 [Fusobacterium perfoetens]|uniref:elongator complex protein 3 n=1 Tax=Fusobacterium perfoetens TaxID=852 RepID=UPI0004800C00|nr:radical SAM protein [Fusobacterium perfoetens]MCI6151703.1 radical SAM protein [Fusobacterium perfoetens]MDY3236541.1 radical SAM protein [Fusobacterium perfoetens]